MTLIWLPRARADVMALVDYIAQDNPDAAQVVKEAIEDFAGRLRDFPELGKPGRVAGTREWVMNRFPYIVVYRLVDRIEIVRVLHGAQQWPPETVPNILRLPPDEDDET